MENDTNTPPAANTFAFTYFPTATTTDLAPDTTDFVLIPADLWHDLVKHLDPRARQLLDRATTVHNTPIHRITTN